VLDLIGLLLQPSVSALRLLLLVRRSFGGVFVDRQTSVYLLNQHGADLKEQFLRNLRFPFVWNRNSNLSHVDEVIFDDGNNKTTAIGIRVLKVQQMLLENSIQRIDFFCRGQVGGIPFQYLLGFRHDRGES
jgi:hypothetical protein